MKRRYDDNSIENKHESRRALESLDKYNQNRKNSRGTIYIDQPSHHNSIKEDESLREMMQSILEGQKKMQSEIEKLKMQNTSDSSTDQRFNLLSMLQGSEFGDHNLSSTWCQSHAAPALNHGSPS